MLQPAVRVPTLRVMVRPVDNAATIIGFELAVERHRITDGQRLNPGREIYVVRDQYAAPGRQLQNEALVPAAFVVVRKNPADCATAADLFTRTPAAVVDRNFVTGSRIDAGANVADLHLLVEINQADDD